MKNAARRNDFLVPLMRPVLLATPVAVWIAIGVFGCGTVPCTTPECTGERTEDPVDIGRGTVDSLIAVYLPHVYSTTDSAGYEEMLDERYSFQKLPDDPDEPVQELFWDKFEELRIGGRMFRGTPNLAGQSVESITLNVNVGSKTPSFDTDQPDDENWIDVFAIIDMTVVLNDPGQSDGTGILNLLIDSEQKFVAADDRDSAGLWVVVKQEDRARIN
ncbi:MAG: hypothetical protein HKN20_11890 [Gemmatimonadetes bacterium]|nr:hypothetical protein [Gemmatimonadota bacterium]